MTASFPQTAIARLSDHTGPVHALTFSGGSGQYVLSGGQDRTVRLWNPASKRLIQSYRAHGYEVLDIAVSDDNARFVSVGGDKTVFLWDVATAQTTRRFNGHAGKVNACAFGGDGESVIVTGSFDGTIKIWDCKSRSEKPIMTFSEAKDSVSSIAVREHEIYAGSIDGRVRTYDLARGCVEVDALGSSVTSVAVTTAADSYLASTLDSTARLMDRPTGKCLQTFKHAEFRNDSYRTRSCLAMADASVIAGSENGSVCVWDVLSGELQHRLWHKQDQTASVNVKKDVVAAVAWNQMRKQWASAGGDGVVVIWGLDEK
ncbi:hypothetical protein AMS68_007967 [Peltaster fructicola]|uniref:Uncharacterized protein n=1 Tax=Peltaster fructicola TaxID=286661 RepID=A0A6H0Y766_9PEZI|nr:hypothetical protein AMS68_007967 [Peltaster fructicola]